jgi:hypothetical protein
MPDAAALADQQDRALARLLEFGLAAAEKVHDRLIATEDDALLGELSLALNRASRNVRQTIALQMRAARDRDRQDRGETALATKAQEARTSRRRAQVKAAVERIVWTEADDSEAERLLDHLDDRIDEDALYEDFTAEPVAAHIARMCAELGVTAPPPEEVDRRDRAEAEGASPTGSPAGGATPWRSSG